MTPTQARGKPLPSADELRRLFRYDKETGELLRIKTNTIVKTKNGSGYLKTRINNGNEVHVSRIAWKIMTGRDPIGEIDHINRNRSDNRWANLREVTRKQNNCNMSIRADNRTGFKGVGISREGRYIARIVKDGKEYYLGSFWSAEEASEAYKKAAIEMHKEFSPAHRERMEIIEQCAQVADNFDWTTSSGDMPGAIAAAIRALATKK